MSRRHDPPIVSHLSPILECPDRRCRKPLFFNPELITTALPCPRCHGHFWVTRFAAGNLRAQLVDHYDGEEVIVDYLMCTFDLPMTIPQPMYWAVWLPGDEFHRYNRDDATAPWARSAALLRRLIARLHRKAS